jgi:ethanolamine utilization protein EutQ (cupin superfamily)
MPTVISSPAHVRGFGNKRIDEYVGRVVSKTDSLSIAHMHSPQGWTEPGQRPAFDEYTVVLTGRLHVRTEQGELDIEAGQAIVVAAGEWVQYSTPDGAEYIAVCQPAFSPDTVHRDSVGGG